MTKSNETHTTRQYVIFYRRGGNRDWGQLEPIVHERLYTRQEIALAVAIVQTHPFIEGICVRLGDDVFNVIAQVVSDDDPKDPKAFSFVEKTAASDLVLPEGA